MRQKVQTICAFLPDTPILLIDEPFMGLDVYAIDYLEKLMIEKALAGTSILLTTHQLDVVKDLAEDRKSTRLNSSHVAISYAVFCLKKKKTYFTLSTMYIYITNYCHNCTSYAWLINGTDSGTLCDVPTKSSRPYNITLTWTRASVLS